MADVRPLLMSGRSKHAAGHVAGPDQPERSPMRHTTTQPQHDREDTQGAARTPLITTAAPARTMDPLPQLYAQIAAWAAALGWLPTEETPLFVRTVPESVWRVMWNPSATEEVRSPRGYFVGLQQIFILYRWAPVGLAYPGGAHWLRHAEVSAEAFIEALAAAGAGVSAPSVPAREERS